MAVVTAIYRKYLYLYAKYDEYNVDPSDLRDLGQVFNRGGFTEGYLYGNPKKNLLSGDLSKHEGIYIGKVVSSTEQAFRGAAEKKGTRLPYEAILKGFYKDDQRVVPVIPNITKGWHDQNIRKNFDKIVAESAQKGIAVGNIGWIEPFVETGVNVFGDYGLNLFNSPMTAEVLY